MSTTQSIVLGDYVFCRPYGESKDGAGPKSTDLGASHGRENLFVTTNKLFLTESVLTFPRKVTKTVFQKDWTALVFFVFVKTEVCFSTKKNS